MEFDPKFIWALCLRTAVLIGWDHRKPAPSRIWAHIRGRYWSAKIDDFCLWPPGDQLTLYPESVTEKWSFTSHLYASHLRGGRLYVEKIVDCGVTEYSASPLSHINRFSVTPPHIPPPFKRPSAYYSQHRSDKFVNFLRWLEFALVSIFLYMIVAKDNSSTHTRYL